MSDEEKFLVRLLPERSFYEFGNEILQKYLEMKSGDRKAAAKALHISAATITNRLDLPVESRKEKLAHSDVGAGLKPAPTETAKLACDPESIPSPSGQKSYGLTGGPPEEL